MIAAAILLGCAAREVPPVPTVAHDDPACRNVSGETGERWHSRTPGEPWTDGGSHFVVCSGTSSATEDADGASGDPGASAETPAIEQAYTFAFEKLASRGVSFGEERTREMVRERVEAWGRGEEVEFPRVRVAGRLIESCQLRSQADEWRASLLVEYPIAFLRGDVNNASWNAARAVREAEATISSARAFFAEGRWFDGVMELERSGAVLAGASETEDSGALRAEIERLRAWASAAISIRPVREIVVVEIGQRGRVEAAFECAYEWEGRPVPAVGVPLEFRLDGFEAVLDRSPESGRDGVGRCGIIVAFGDAGRCSIVAAVDSGVLAGAAGTGWVNSVDSPTGEQTVFLVEGAHGLSVCLEISGLEPADEAQLRSGFERRAGADGYRVADCGADVAIVITASATVSSEPVGQGWSAASTVSATAFDQRVAAEIASTTISADGRADEDGRQAEILALKEAGRLLAAYLSNRILLSRG